MIRTLLLSISKKEWVKRAVVAFPPTRAVVGRFVAGESLDECIAAARRLVERGLWVSIDHLGEDTTSESQARRTADAYVELLARLAAEGLSGRAEASVKLSAIGQALPGGQDVALVQLRRICEAARAAGTTVTLDMEDHTTTDRTLETLRAIRAEFPGTGGVLQAYLRRTPDDCRALAHAGSRIRLCKGAYDEPPSVALRSRTAVGAAYAECLGILVRGDGYPMIATHDPAMIAAALELIDRSGRAPDTYEFQMLHGIRTREQVRLADAGHRLRVYLPYGTDWYGYFMRRLAERPANLLFFVRALLGRG